MTHRPKPTNRGSVARTEPHAKRVPARDPASHQQDQAAALHALQAAIQDGLNSGVSDKTLRQIWAKSEQRHQSRNG